MTWGQFKRQYEAEGREKADGYTPRDFEGMSESELDQARTMMLERALAGDDVDLRGLRFIGDATTVAALQAMDDAERRYGWRYDINRHEVLFELTNDASYLTSLTYYLDGSDKEAQERAADAFTWHILPPAAEPFLVERIGDGRHEAAILALLQAWIGMKQRSVCDMMCFQRHLAWIQRVSGAKPDRRPALLEQWQAEPGAFG